MKNKKLIAVVLLVALVTCVVWVLIAKNSNKLNNNILLFKKYVEAKDNLNALKTLQIIEKDADKLKQGQSMYVASNAAGIARKDGDYELERDIYKRFFEVRFPFYYHLFSSGSYGAQNNLTQQKEELYQARQCAVDEAQKSVIDRLLLINEKKAAMLEKRGETGLKK